MLSFFVFLQLIDIFIVKIPKILYYMQVPLAASYNLECISIIYNGFFWQKAASCQTADSTESVCTSIESEL